MADTSHNFYLYILARTDLPSMNTGKGYAQSGHIGTKFYNDMTIKHGVATEYPPFAEWIGSSDGAGTKISLGVTGPELVAATTMAESMGFQTGVYTDPTYPYIVTQEIADLIVHPDGHPPQMLKGGMALCLRSEMTMGYVFGHKDAVQPVLGQFDLHP